MDGWVVDLFHVWLQGGTPNSIIILWHSPKHEDFKGVLLLWIPLVAQERKLPWNPWCLDGCLQNWSCLGIFATPTLVLAKWEKGIEKEVPARLDLELDHFESPIKAVGLPWIFLLSIPFVVQKRKFRGGTIMLWWLSQSGRVSRQHCQLLWLRILDTIDFGGAKDRRMISKHILFMTFGSMERKFLYILFSLFCFATTRESFPRLPWHSLWCWWLDTMPTGHFVLKDRTKISKHIPFMTFGSMERKFFADDGSIFFCIIAEGIVSSFLSHRSPGACVECAGSGQGMISRHTRLNPPRESACVKVGRVRWESCVARIYLAA